jgi:hypothetical protein
MNSIEGKEEFTELGAVLEQLEKQFDTPAHQRKIESLAYALTMGECDVYGRNTQEA